MSSQVLFTPVQPQEQSGMIYTGHNSHAAGVRIIDLDGLKEELSDTLVTQMDTRSVSQRDEYPAKEWEYLLGFTTYGDTDASESGSGADFHNVSGTDPEDMANLWESVSEYTDPFVVYMTSFEGSWPHPATLDLSNKVIYRVTARDGEATLAELSVGVVDSEPVDF